MVSTSSVIVQASKNVFAPGASFGAYSASKAGQHQLGKIAALEFAELGVRVNMVNADAVFGDAVPSGLWAEVGPDRMKSRGLDSDGLRSYYRDRNLLKTAVLAEHVGNDRLPPIRHGLGRLTIGPVGVLQAERREEMVLHEIVEVRGHVGR